MHSGGPPGQWFGDISPCSCALGIMKQCQHLSQRSAFSREVRQVKVEQVEVEDDKSKMVIGNERLSPTPLVKVLVDACGP